MQLDKLYLDTVPVMRVYVQQRLPAELVEDVIQDAWTKTIARQPEYVGAYVWQTLKHNVIDYYRRRKPVLVELDTLLTVGQDKRNAYDAKVLLEQIWQLMTERERIAFTMQALAYSNNEIATYLNTTEGAVKALMHRCRKRLIKYVEN